MIANVTDGAYLVACKDGIVELTFNRPEARNPIPTAAILPLANLFEAIAADPDVRSVLVRGRGDNFGGGGDVAGMKTTLDLSRAERSELYWQRLDNASAMVRNWCAIPQPIVVECQGSVAGAAMMYTLGADVVIGDDTTYFLCAHNRIGLTPDSGLSYLLPRVVGVSRAIELFLSARKVLAQEALAIGLMHRIVPSTDLSALAMKQAHQFSRGPQDVLRSTKAMIKASLVNSIDVQLDWERDIVAEQVACPDFEEGVSAFIEKRRARFSASDLSK